MYNHYIKLKQLTLLYPGYKILLIEEPTTTKRFDGTSNYYNHYYRLIDEDGNQIKYGKFQQLDKLAQVLKVDVTELEKKIVKTVTK